jgi:hypothetical protein
MASAIAFVAWPRGFWMLDLAALVVSQGVIVTSWLDARFGTIANVLLLGSVVIGAAMWGPTSARARLERESAEGLARVRAAGEAAVVTEADLAALPAPLASYLRAAGWLGRSRTAAYHLRFRGRIRGGADEPWMDFTVEQQSFADRPTRLFLMDASMYGLPVQSFHRFADGHASFEVRIAGLVPIVDARGAELDQAETVTLFNDMCLLVPTTLLSPDVTYEEIDAHTVLARFTHAGRTISARLFFGDDGMLRDFVSDDRFRSSRDGSTFTPQRFSTPIHETRAFGPVRLAARADARWHPPEGELVYGEFELLEITFVPGAVRQAAPKPPLSKKRGNVIHCSTKSRLTTSSGPRKGSGAFGSARCTRPCAARATIIARRPPSAGQPPVNGDASTVSVPSWKSGTVRRCTTSAVRVVCPEA